MHLFDRFSTGHMRLGRIEGFSDGVFAIVVTLLVLDFTAPVLRNASNPEELGHHLITMLPALLSWMISFIIVCKFWLNHHWALGLAAYADYGVVWLNSIFLMFQSFVPFPTDLMGRYPANPVAVSLFGIVMALNTFLFMALQSYIFKHLLKPECANERDPNGTIKALVGPLFYLIGAAVAWRCTPASFVFYIITPLFFITPPTRKTEEQATDENSRAAAS
jgi:uncharacterized membrane protein